MQNFRQHFSFLKFILWLHKKIKRFLELTKRLKVHKFLIFFDDLITQSLSWNSFISSLIFNTSRKLLNLKFFCIMPEVKIESFVLLYLWCTWRNKEVKNLLCAFYTTCSFTGWRLKVEMTFVVRPSSECWSCCDRFRNEIYFYCYMELGASVRLPRKAMNPSEESKWFMIIAFNTNWSIESLYSLIKYFCIIIEVARTEIFISHSDSRAKSRQLSRSQKPVNIKGDIWVQSKTTKTSSAE